MLETLLTEWNKVKENKLTTSELAKFYSEAVTTIRDTIIPNFFIQESGAIKELLDSPKNTKYEVRSLDVPYKEMSEYDIGVRQYLESTMEKVVTESDNDGFLNLVRDIENVRKNSSSFVDQLFEDELNPCHRVPVEEAISCLESMIDLQEQCTVMLENGQEIEQLLSTCSDARVRDELADLYYKTESSFLLEYLKEGFQIYDTIMGRNKSSDDSGSVQLL